MQKTPEELMRDLAELGIEVTTHRHPPLFTVEESRSLRGEIAGRHTKNLFLRDRKDRYFLVALEEDAQVDLKSVHHAIGASGRVSFGKPEKLMAFLGVEPGAVTLFGATNDTGRNVTIVLDAALMEHAVINVHPLHNQATTSIRSEDLMRFLRSTGHEPLVLKVSQ